MAPARLTTAIYLSRHRPGVTLNSRAALIPRTRNCLGFDGGGAGNHLVAQLREQIGRYEAEVEGGVVEPLTLYSDGVYVSLADRS